MNKVPLSSLIGKTPVTVRFRNGATCCFTSIKEDNGDVDCVSSDRISGGIWAFDELVEVLPAKETPTPLTDVNQWETDEGSEVVDADFASNLELDRAALLALVERQKNASQNLLDALRLMQQPSDWLPGEKIRILEACRVNLRISQDDARALLAQLKP